MATMKVIGGRVKILSDSKMRVVVNPEQVLSPNYSLWVDSLTANETDANTVIFYLSAENVTQSNFPLNVPFKVVGQTNQNDFVVGTELSGAFVLYDNNWTASTSFEILADSLTDGDKTMTLVLTSVAGIECPSEAQSLSADVLVYDTSLFPPGYTLSLTPTEGNETDNNVFDVKLTTTGVPNGTKVPFVLSGTNITVADFTGVSTLSGLFEVTGASEPVDITPVITTLTYTVTADNVTEGTETLAVILSSAGGITCPVEAQGQTKYATIYDTSVEAVASADLYATLVGAGGSLGGGGGIGGNGHRFTVSIKYDSQPTDVLEYMVGGPGSRAGTHCTYGQRSSGANGYGSGGLGGVGQVQSGGDAGGSTMLRVKRNSNILFQIVAGSGGGGGTHSSRPGGNASFTAAAGGGSSNGGCTVNKKGNGTAGANGRGGGGGGSGYTPGYGGGGGKSFIVINDPSVVITQLADDTLAPLPISSPAYGTGSNGLSGFGVGGKSGALVINYAQKNYIETNTSFQGMLSSTLQ